MTPSARHRLLLDQVCGLIQDPAVRARIRSMDPTDRYTFFEAYVAVRRVPGLTRTLHRQVRHHLFGLMDDEAAESGDPGGGSGVT